MAGFIHPELSQLGLLATSSAPSFSRQWLTGKFEHGSNHQMHTVFLQFVPFKQFWEQRHPMRVLRRTTFFQDKPGRTAELLAAARAMMYTCKGRYHYSANGALTTAAIWQTSKIHKNQSLADDFHVEVADFPGHDGFPQGSCTPVRVSLGKVFLVFSGFPSCWRQMMLAFWTFLAPTEMTRLHGVTYGAFRPERQPASPRLRAATKHLFHGLQPHGHRDLLPQAPTFGVIHLAPRPKRWRKRFLERFQNRRKQGEKGNPFEIVSETKWLLCGGWFLKVDNLVKPAMNHWHGANLNMADIVLPWYHHPTAVPGVQVQMVWTWIIYSIYVCAYVM